MNTKILDVVGKLHHLLQVVEAVSFKSMFSNMNLDLPLVGIQALGVVKVLGQFEEEAAVAC